MMKYRKSALIASISFIILFSLSLFLYSCGVSSPTGSSSNAQVSNTQARPTGLNAIPISLTDPPVQVSAISDSSSSNSLTIKWANYPNATSYNIYYSNTSDYINPAKISPASSPYTHNLTNPEKDYYYFITAIINGEEKRISGDLVSLSKQNKRLNLILSLEPVYNFLKNKGTQNPVESLNHNSNNINAYYQAPAPLPINGPLTLTLSTTTPPPGCFGTNLSYYHWVLLPDVSISYYTLAGKDQGFGDPPFYYNYARKITSNPFSYSLLWGEIEPNTNISVTSTDTTTTYTSSQPTPGWYAVTGSYMQHNGCAQSWMGITDFPTSPLTVTVQIGNKTITDTGIDTPTLTNQKGYFLYPSILSSWPSLSFALGGNEKKLKSIDLQPTQATIYAYPITSASHQQKYIATGIFTDGSKVDITNSVKWHVWDIPIASVSNSGIATPASSPTTYKPGTTSINAASTTSSTNMIISNIVELTLECFDYKVHYRQNDSTWMDIVYNDYKTTGGTLPSGMLDHSIGAVGCYITSVANAMNATGTDVTPQQLNDWMKKPNNGFTSKHSANGNRAFDYPGAHIKAITDWQDANTADIKNQLSQCNIILARVVGTTAFTGGHYVLIVKENKGRLMMLDPWKRSTDSNGIFYDYVDNYYTITNYKVLSVKQK